MARARTHGTPAYLVTAVFDPNALRHLGHLGQQEWQDGEGVFRARSPTVSGCPDDQVSW